MKTARHPLGHKAPGTPKTADISGRYNAPAAGPQRSPYARLKWEKRRERAELPYLLMDANLRWLHTRVRLTHGLHFLGPRGTEARAPSLRSDSLHERKECRQLLPAPFKELLKSAIIKCKLVSKKNYTRIPLRARRTQPRTGRAASSSYAEKVAEAENSQHHRFRTGSRLLRGPYT